MQVDYLVAISIVIMSLMAVSVILFVILYQRKVIRHQLELESKKQIELFQTAAQSEEEERQRIAAELHDDIGATLSSARLFLHQAEKISTEPGLIKQSGQLVDDSIRKVRDISHKLQPAILQSLGLHTALQALAEVYKRSGSIKFDVLPSSNLPRLDPHVEMHLYRIVQELTNNILKHSKASFIIMQISEKNSEQILTIQHDGEGLSDDSFNSLVAQKGGIGLKNISSRLKFINGKIAFTQQGRNSFLTEIRVSKVH